MRSWQPKHRVFLEEKLETGRVRYLDHRATHYLIQVLRLTKNAQILVFNAQDGEYRAEITNLQRHELEIRISEQTRKPWQGADIVLICALPKKPAWEEIIQKATECGATHIQPAISQRTNNRPHGQNWHQDRYEKIAIEAAEQSERLTIPRIFSPCKLTDILEGWSSDTPLILAAEAGKTQNAKETLCQFSPAKPIGFLVGPEGGFSEEEFVLMQQKPYIHPIRLGPYILRAPTACCAILAAWQVINS